MAFKGIEMVLALVLGSMLLSGAMAQLSCTSTITSLAPCLNFVTGSSANPSSSCCSQLSNVVQSSPQCLCSLVNGASSLGITINQTLALSLPGACKVQTPPPSRCQGANGPSTSSGANGPSTSSSTPPASSPAASSNETPSEASTPEASISPSASDIPSSSGGGSKTVPSSNGNTSDGSTSRTPLHFVLFLVFVMSCASSLSKF
ncbi:non-specific lipid transfer protein GPI-anchored 15-like isoform X1 [Pyrus communis]|uniref:non-specific lipid transfer protein GPI-anchored 15-like isoform X1 n=1 Tax=Pyrus communis TaxID=23211 RepID=UPI0035C2499A